jgi:predicted DCC family thiol-disulfide oxidoreductase YuxK
MNLGILNSLKRMNNLDKIVLFDGVCNFCQSSVQFIIKHESNQELRFASLQSEFGKSIIQQYQIPKDIDSIVFIEHQKAYIKSDAALKISTYFKFPFKLLTIFKIVPTFIRNKVYDYIAKNRYAWFGKQDACMLPNAEIRNRFIEV